jgi:uncharacterized protein DUF6279
MTPDFFKFPGIRIPFLFRRDHLFFRLACLFLIGLTLSSCGRTQLAYRFSDWFLLNKVDDYFQLNNSQEKFLKEKFDHLMEWHRTHELPEIVLTLSEFQERYRDGLDAEDIKWLQEDERSYFMRIFIQAAPDFSRFLSTLDERQIQHFKNQSDKMNDFLIEQSKMTDEELVDDTQQWFLELLEDWFGPLDSDQKITLQIWITVERGWIVRKLQTRRKFQKAFADLLEAQKPEKEIEAQLIGWIKQPEILWASKFQAQLEEKKSQWMKVLFKIDSMITPAQRNRALKKVQRYIDDFKSLAI